MFHATLYDKLETHKKSHAKELKKQFLRMAKKYHPNYSQNGSEKIFAEIVYAYQILNNKRHRYFYDHFGEVGLSMVTNDQAWHLVSFVFNRINMHAFAFIIVHLILMYFSIPFLLLMKSFYWKRIPFYTFGVYLGSASSVAILVLVRIILHFITHINLFLNHIILGVLISFKITLLTIQVIIGMLYYEKRTEMSIRYVFSPLILYSIIAIIENLTIIIALKKKDYKQGFLNIFVKPCICISAGLSFLLKINIFAKFIIFWALLSLYLLLFGDPIPRIARIIIIFIFLTYTIGCFVFEKFEHSLYIRFSLLVPYLTAIFCIWRTLIILENIKPRPKLSRSNPIEEYYDITDIEECEIMALASKIAYLPDFKSHSLALYQSDSKRFFSFDA